MQAAYLYKEQIKEDIIFLSSVKKQKGSERNILNKWFQDSVKNYFLETYASPFLKNELGEGLVKKVKQNIEKRMSDDGLKFMNLLNQYKIELENFDKSQKFVNSLITIIIDDQKLERGSALWAKQAKKKFVALMLIVLMEYNEGKVTSFYDMWNYIFPSEVQIKKKLSKEDKQRLKVINSNTSLSVNSQSPTLVSLSSPMNSSTTLGYQLRNINKSLLTQSQILKNVPDTASQCSRTCDFQEIDNFFLPLASFKYKIDTKQEMNEQLLMNNQQQQQQQYIAALPSPSSQSQFTLIHQLPYGSLTQAEFTNRQPSSQVLQSHSQNHMHNSIAFVNTPDILRKISNTLPIKHEMAEHEMIHLDDQQFFIDRQDEFLPATQNQQQNQFSIEPHAFFQTANPHSQSQIQYSNFKYSFPEQPLSAHNSSMSTAMHLQNSPPQMTSASANGQQSNYGGFYSNNVEINNYFNVDQLFSQNGINQQTY